MTAQPIDWDDLPTEVPNFTPQTVTVQVADFAFAGGTTVRWFPEQRTQYRCDCGWTSEVDTLMSSPFHQWCVHADVVHEEHHGRMTRREATITPLYDARCVCGWESVPDPDRATVHSALKGHVLGAAA